MIWGSSSGTRGDIPRGYAVSSGGSVTRVLVATWFDSEGFHLHDDIGREVNAGRPVWLLKVRGLPRPLSDISDSRCQGRGCSALSELKLPEIRLWNVEA